MVRGLVVVGGGSLDSFLSYSFYRKAEETVATCKLSAFRFQRRVIVKGTVSDGHRCDQHLGMPNKPQLQPSRPIIPRQAPLSRPPLLVLSAASVWRTSPPLFDIYESVALAEPWVIVYVLASLFSHVHEVFPWNLGFSACYPSIFNFLVADLSFLNRGEFRMSVDEGRYRRTLYLLSNFRSHYIKFPVSIKICIKILKVCIMIDE